MEISAFLERLRDVKPSGEGWTALCPAHEDNRRSLSVGTGEGDRILLHCHAGCTLDAILAALGVNKSGLFRDEHRNGRMRRAQIVAEYDYTDTEGRLLYQVVRFDGKAFRQRRPDGNGGWIWNLKDTPRVLYRLPKVREAVALRRPVFVTEGERDVHTLEGLSLTATTNPGGAEKWDSSYGVSLRGAHVVILPDNDVTGRRHAQQVARDLYGKASTIRIVDLPGLPDKGDVTDWVAAGGTWDELQRITRESPRWSPEQSPELPTIELTNRPLRDVADDALKALQRANKPPFLFVRGGALTRTRMDEHGRPLIETIGSAELRGMLTRSADFVRVMREQQRQVSPPDDVVADTLHRGAWPFPALDNIVEIPTLRPDGSVLERPGYDSGTRLLFAPPENLSPRSVTEEPSAEELRAAREAIDEVIADFPFADEASRANLFGLMLTPIVRAAVRGPVPLAVIDAPQQGTGKSLLAEIVYTIATGRDAAMLAAPRQEEEWAKVLTGALSEGASVICFDNVDHKLQEASLALALTARIWKGRVLGASRTVELPIGCTWIATGNNVRLGGDLPRRSYWIRIDAKSNRPWQRSDFRHPDLKGYVLDRRQELVRALLTLARSWYAAGCPRAPVPRIGSYEEWARIVGGILAHASVEPFLGNIEEFYSQTDDSEIQWEAFLEAWHDHFGPDAQTVAGVLYALQENLGLRETLPDELAGDFGSDLGGFRKRLGRALGRRAGVRHGATGWRIERAAIDSDNKQQRWSVKRD